MDFYGADREALNTFERYLTNSIFSDVTLIVSGKVYHAHRLILAKNSDVFERMLSETWCGETKDLKLVEEDVCAEVFHVFLRFLYCNHVVLSQDNALPVLMLADKYNVARLQQICIDFALSHVLPNLSLKDVFHQWFQYSRRSCHKPLGVNCLSILAKGFHNISSHVDWRSDWLNMDFDQLTEFLKTSDLCVVSEFELWQAILRWLQAPRQQQDMSMDKYLNVLLPLLRFPLMTAEELYQLEKCQFVKQHVNAFQTHLTLAYKYHALPLCNRASPNEFTGSQFLLRNYTKIRWDKRFTVYDVRAVTGQHGLCEELTTKASAETPASWDWEMTLYPNGSYQRYSVFTCTLMANAVTGQTRAVEYLLSIVDETKILRSSFGKNTFSEKRNDKELWLVNHIPTEEIIAENSELLVNNNLHLQLTLRPIQ